MKRSKHNLSHYHLTSVDMGKLIPVGLIEALPGDTIQQYTNVLARVSPLVAPVMHPVSVRIHHFFVPHRLVWDNWEEFITGGPNGDSPWEWERLPSPTAAKTLYDYFGVSPGIQLDVATAPIRAFNMIYNEYYRDQDLVTERTATDSSVPSIAWEKDYFTSARPWTQKGPDVTLPIGTSAPVIGETADPFPTFETANSTTQNMHLAATNTSTNVDFDKTAGESTNVKWQDPGLIADLSTATGAKINDIRTAFALQRYQEARARYGSRYTEYLRYLGVTPKDERLQRPEFLGGGSTQINFSEVLQTTPDAGGSGFGVGDMYGHGVAAMRSNKYRRFIEEHGYIMSLLSVRPKAMYQQGLARHWLKNDKEEFYQRELEQVGQQEVYLGELWPDPTKLKNTFGYQDRYSEYKFQHSYVSGEFRDTLDYWHMARQHGAEPALNESFITCNPTKRIHNVQVNDAMWIMAQHKIAARRIVSKSGRSRVL